MDDNTSSPKAHSAAAGLICRPPLQLALVVLLVSACNTSESVPKNRSIEGCYYTGDSLTLVLRRGEMRLPDRSIKGTYRRGADEVGTYVSLSPAVRLDKGSKPPGLIVNSGLPAAQYVVIQSLGDVFIRIPTEPLGEELLKLRPCEHS